MTRIENLPGSSLSNRGLALEKELQTLHDFYERHGLARIDKQQVRAIPTKDNRIAKIIGKSTVDYTGVIAGGRFVAFDAKDCAEKRIPLNRLQEHQGAYLMAVDALGGLAFILARFEYRHVYRIPIDIWVCADLAHHFGVDRVTERVDGWKPTGMASLSIRDMREEWKVRGVDWLRGVGE